MTTVEAAKQAVSEGEHEKALTMVRHLLKTRPSAEVHYLAAVLAPNSLMARKQLVNALHHDPNYLPAMAMLQVLERQERLSATDKLRTDLLNAIECEQDAEETHPMVGVLDRVRHFVGVR